jgi:hypothetical protein
METDAYVCDYECKEAKEDKINKKEWQLPPNLQDVYTRMN